MKAATQLYSPRKPSARKYSPSPQKPGRATSPSGRNSSAALSVKITMPVMLTNPFMERSSRRPSI